MEDSKIASLPPDLVAEAQNRRRDWEHRNRQTFHERLVTHSQANSTRVLDGTAYLPPRILSIQNLRGRPSWRTNSVRYNSLSSSSNAPGEGSFPKFPGKPVVVALMKTEGTNVSHIHHRSLPIAKKEEQPKSSTSNTLKSSKSAVKKKRPSIFDVLLKLDCTTRHFKSSSKDVKTTFLPNPQLKEPN